MKIYEEEKASMHINYIVNLGNMLFTNNYILEVEKLQKKDEQDIQLDNILAKNKILLDKINILESENVKLKGELVSKTLKNMKSILCPSSKLYASIPPAGNANKSSVSLLGQDDHRGTSIAVVICNHH